MKNLRVVHLTSVHPAFDVRIFFKECKTLATQFEVSLVAPHPTREAIVDGIRVVGVDRPVNRKHRFTSTVRKVYKVALDLDADVYHFHDPELIPAGILLKAHGKRVVYDVHEDVPRQVLVKSWIPRFLRGLTSVSAALMERLASPLFDGIVAATPIIARRFPKRKTVTLHNFPILTELRPSDGPAYKSRAPQVVYAGGISELRGLREMIESLALVDPKLDVRLKIAGDLPGEPLLSEMRGLRGSERVEFVGWQSRPQIAELLKTARIGIVVLHPIQNYLESYPVKLFEYMASGLPVVASNFPIWRSIVQEARCGILVNPLEPKSIADAIAWLLANPDEAEKMGRRGQRAIEQKFNWEHESTKLMSLYKAIGTRS